MTPTPERPTGQRGGAGRGTGKPEDVVYTPGWCAADMVEHFQPTGVVLDPCRGLGAFHDLLPDGSPWCEISEGVDFFDWHDRVDWVIGNPPYSLTRPWFRHSTSIADHLVYLIPLRNLFSGYGFIRELSEWGGLRELRLYGTGGRLGFPMGNAVGAVYASRGWRGPCAVSFFDAMSESLLDEMDPAS